MKQEIHDTKTVKRTRMHKIDHSKSGGPGFPKVTFNPEKVMTKRLQNPEIPKKNGSKTVSSKTDQKK